MHDDNEILRNIPPFLRRCGDPRRTRAPAALPTEIQQAQSPDAQGPGTQAFPSPVIGLAARPAETIDAGGPLSEQSASIELAIGNETVRDDAGSADLARRATLPQGVVGQAGMPAAKQDTTRRTNLLRALRLAGLWAPEQADRRDRTAKRRRQA